MFLCSCLMLLGCSRGPPEGVSSHVLKVSKSASRIQQHFFGILRPTSQASHTFLIHNDSVSTWTFQRLHTSCSCVITKPSFQSIAPRANGELKVTYQAPRQSSDHHTRVGIEFAEPDAPVLWFELAAKVRQPVSVFPSSLSIPRVGRGQSTEQVIELYNYTADNIDLLSLVPKDSWITAKAVPIPITNQSGDDDERIGSPRQMWRIVVRADTTDLKVGRHLSHLVIHTSAQCQLTTTLPIDMTITPPVEAIPAQLFFGTVPGASSVPLSFLLEFADETAALDLTEVTCGAIGNPLEIVVQRLSSKRRRVTATLHTGPTAPGSIIEVALEVHFRESSLPRMSIPIYARVHGD
jgi:hypothetical protein